MVFNKADSIRDDEYTRKLKLPIFGFHIAFTEEEQLSGKFEEETQSDRLLRCWDFNLPKIDQPIWHGYARRYINAYVPHFNESDKCLEGKYGSLEDADDVSEIKLENPKTFNHLACEERYSEDGQNFIGKIAIATLKGDVDNLGTIFQQGLKEPTFAKMAALSRQMNHFFSLCCLLIVLKNIQIFILFLPEVMIFSLSDHGCKHKNWQQICGKNFNFM